MEIDIDQIKRLVIIALASDDELMERLVLKGGNAIGLLQPGKIGHLIRSSFDIDFSIEDDFDEELERISARIKKTVENTFKEHGLTVFDYKFSIRPRKISEKVRDFWGGYIAEFKLVTTEHFDKVKGDLEVLRREAISVSPGGSPKIEIDISKYEYVGKKMETNVDGYTIFIYTPEMIAFEKLRAICQQLPAYSEIVPAHSPRPRGRDFYDIPLIMNSHEIDPGTAENKKLLKDIFSAKKVPLEFIQNIPEDLARHRQDWQNVLDTLSPQEQKTEFETNAEFIIEKFCSLTFP